LLADAQTEARAHAPEGAELAARVRAAEIARAAAGRIFRVNPTISGTVVPGTITGHPDELSWDVGVQQTFDVSGSWGPRRASADAAWGRAGFQRDDGLRALDEAVAVTVADLANAQRHVRRAERIAKLQEVAAHAAHTQLQVGQGNQLDVDGADLDLAATRADAARARGELTEARARLARLLGREVIGDLSVDDPVDTPAPETDANVAALVERDPRVRAADAELRSARFELATFKRMAWPTLTLGTSFGYRRRDIPAGSLTGAPIANQLTANWTDTELGFSLSLPLPLFDRKQTERAQATGRILAAEAAVRSVRADVRQQLAASWAELQATTDALRELSSTPEIVDREFGLLDKAMQAGALDAVARAFAIRRLQEAAIRFDTAVRDLRVARAHWARRSTGL